MKEEETSPHNLIHTISSNAPRWPVNKHSSTDHIFRRQESPDMSIKAVIAIISKHEHVSGGYKNRSEFVCCILCSERLVLHNSIDIKLATLYFDCVTLMGQVHMKQVFKEPKIDRLKNKK